MRSDFPQFYFYFPSITSTPITRVLHDPKISVSNNDIISAVLSCSIFLNSLMVLDSVRYNNCIRRLDFQQQAGGYGPHARNLSGIRRPDAPHAQQKKTQRSTRQTGKTNGEPSDGQNK